MAGLWTKLYNMSGGVTVAVVFDYNSIVSKSVDAAVAVGVSVVVVVFVFLFCFK